MLPGGSGDFAYIQNMKLNTIKFKSGGLHEKHAMATWEPSEHLRLGIRKTRKTCVEVAGRRTFPILTSSQQSDMLRRSRSAVTYGAQIEP